MSRVVLIGNGPSALEKEVGEEIDKFDSVIRFNRWKYDQDGSEYTKDFSKFVGTKCDYWIVNDLHLTETKLAINKYPEYEAILVVFPNFKYPTPLQIKDITQEYPNIHFIPKEYENSINEIVDFKPSWPSTGLVGIHFAIQHFDEVYLHGFDVYDTKYDTLHYFEDKNAEYGKNKYKFSTKSDHTPKKEVDYFKYIVENHNVKYL
jgi:hypothetical protein